ncbi:8591_t:CDS:2 [Dentiscutata erythropus]|uniref:8591_t:CDS:1 n=1 Tax=Dentiscutata erythropus TaxID=1348616 RepID=A0A9N9IZI7_9GLOM|nr:8591_t:CDS:2 [Dentiscutata erythropus]
MSYSIKPTQISVIEGLIPPIHQKSFYQFDNNSSPYIYDIAATSTYCFISDSNHQITSFEYTNSSLTFAGKLNYHTDTITKLKLHKDQFIISSSKDGRIALWDLRIPSSQPTNVFQAKNREPLLSFDINNSDTILAAGTELIEGDAKILFWDLRKPFLVAAEFIESHNDDITQLQFHPTSDSHFISGSTDGLICSFEVKNFNEDDELIGVINSGSSINKAGYFGPSAEYVYCLTHTETFSLWGLSDINLLCDIGDIRQDRCQGSFIQIDYAIDCQFDFSTNRLYLFAGSNLGNISILHVAINELQLCQTLNDGHSEIVRSVIWNPQVNTLLSGGEDSKLCMWGP